MQSTLFPESGQAQATYTSPGNRERDNVLKRQTYRVTKSELDLRLTAAMIYNVTNVLNYDES